MQGKFSLKISLLFILLFQNGLWKIIKVMVSMVNIEHERCYKSGKIIKRKNSKPYYLIITVVPLRYTRLLSHVQLFLIPWTVARQASLSMGFSRQEYWSGLPFPSGDLSDPGIEPSSPVFLALLADSLPLCHHCDS